LGQNTTDYRPQTLVVPYKPVTYAKQQERTQEIKTKAEMLNSILVRNHPNGGLKFLIVPQDMTLKELSDKFEISERRLKKWNELTSSNLKKNDIIFLESKNSRGNVDTYATVLGDNMHSIAQKFAIKLKKLYSKNRMEDGQQPQIGQLIYLNHKKPRT
jgi:LysM repeat protein